MAKYLIDHHCMSFHPDYHSHMEFPIRVQWHIRAGIAALVHGSGSHEGARMERVAAIATCALRVRSRLAKRSRKR